MGDYTTVATSAPTSASTGYFYARWTQTYPKGTVIDVRAAYLSPYTSIASSFAYIKAFTVR